MSEDRLFKCDSNKNFIPGNFIVVEDSKTTESYIYFKSKDLPKLELKKGEFVYYDMGEIDNKQKLFEIDLFVTNEMIQCLLPPKQSK